MYSLLLILGLGINCLATASEDQIKHTSPDHKNNHALTTITVTRNNVASHHNISYIDKDQNLLRTPNIKKFYDEHKTKKKPKKSPKRTIQKIIKKNKSKMRKLYFNQLKSKPTVPQNVKHEKKHGPEEKQWREDGSTTQVNQRKKSRKFSPKSAGYHMPFQKLQSKKEKRNKRGLSRELYILKDLDEIEFLSKENDEDIVRANVQKFW